MADRALDPISESSAAKRIRYAMESSVIGQPETIDSLVAVTEKLHSGLYDRSRPVSSVLLLGPTGTGKSKLTEAFTKALHGDLRRCITVDCGEFQESDSLNKLIGSPPGYLGHRETPPLFTNARIQSLYSPEYPVAVLIFDEIEKATDALWHLLLGILDKGRLTTGYNEEVDLTNTIILMTSNAGSSEMESALNGGSGFRNTRSGIQPADPKHIADIGVAAAKRKFTPEFINRLDRIIACNSLTLTQCSRVMDLILHALQEEVSQYCAPDLYIDTTPQVRSALLKEGYDPKYNARNLKRVVDQRIRLPLSRIIASGQCTPGDSISIDVDSTNAFVFTAVSKK